MSKTPKFDEKMKPILDALEPSERVSAVTGETWYMGPEEVELYKSFNVPPGKLSPSAKRKRLAIFSTGYQFWWNKHFKTGEPVLTFHHPGSGVRVLPDPEWHNSDFSNPDIELDIDKPLFEQMRQLQLKVPYLATYNLVEPENSIGLLSLGDKNSYFNLASSSINSFFNSMVKDGDEVSSSICCHKITKTHFAGWSENLFRCRYVMHAYDCMDCSFLNDCRNCKNCFGGCGLRNREYVFWNEQLTKGEYEAKMAEIDLGSRSELEKWTKRYDEMCENEMMWPEGFNYRLENSNGEYLDGSVNCFEHFFGVPTAKDCVHCSWTFGDVEHCGHLWGGTMGMDQIECVTSARAQNLKYCMRCNDSISMEYCLQCLNCENCFGCIGLSRKKFCIFNKQYEEEEYWRVVDEIKCKMLERGEYGEFFPGIMATAYQPEGGCIEYCDMDMDEVRTFGINEFDLNAENAAKMDGVDISSMRRVEDIPDSIDDITDDWIGVPIYDEKAQRQFAFLKPEIKHYKELRIAPPNKHFIARVADVDQSFNSCIFTKKNCEVTGQELLVSRNRRWPNRKVLCMEEYYKYLNERN